MRICTIFIWAWIIIWRVASQTSAGVWVKEHVGLVRFVLFYPSEAHKTVVVGTQEGVIASLNLKTGSINWRQVVPEETLDMLSLHDKYLMSVADGVVRVWHIKDGSLHWDSQNHAIPSSHCLSQQLHFSQNLNEMESKPVRKPAVFAEFIPHTTDVVLLSEDTLTRFASSGRIMWTWTDDSTSLRGFTFDDETSKGYVVGYETGSKGLNVWAFSRGFEQAVTEQDYSHDETTFVEGALLDTAYPLNSEENVLILSSGFAVILDQSSGSFEVVDFYLKTKKSFDALLTGSGLKLSAMKTTFDKFKLDSPNREVLFTITSRTSSITLSVSSEHDTIKLETIDHVSNRAVSESLADDGSIYFGSVARSTDGGFLDFGISSRTSQEFTFSTQFSEEDHGAVEQCFLNIFTKGRANAYRFLIVSSDHSISLVQDGNVLWTREEALASVTSTEFMEIPTDYETDSDFDKSKEDIAFPSFQQRLKNQIQHLIDSVTFSSPHQGEIEHDKFGFNKLIIVATSPGKIYAIESSDGKIIWSKYLQKGVPKHIFVTRKHALPHGPAEIVVHSSSYQRNILTHMNALTGEVLVENILPYDIFGFSFLPHTDSHHRHILLAIDTSFKVHAFPDSEEVKSVVKAHVGQLYIHDVNVKKGEIIGYSFYNNSDELISAEKSWNIKFPREIEQICDVAQPQTNDHIQSAVRKFGKDGEFLRKYLNPNMIVVATETRPSSDVPQVVRKKQPNEPSIGIYLIDAVKGSILKKLSYPHSRAPVVIQWENVVVAQYWNAKDQSHNKPFQNDISVLELYLDEHESFDETVFSSFTASAPVVEAQSYSMETASKVLGVTKTRMGIASRQLLLGSMANQILSIDKALLDPQRPEKPTAADAAKGVLPYKMNIPFVTHQNTVTMNYTVPQLSHITTYGALVESTSLVLGWGLDIFFCRVTPSKSFDMLNADFNAPLLIGTLTIVFGAITVVHFLVKRKELKSRWK